MRRRWWVVGGTLLALLGVSAVGITAHADWLRGRWDAAQASAHLATRLQGLPGVASATATYDPIGLPDAGLEVRVAFRPDAPSASWGRANAAVRTAAASDALRTVIPVASFRQDGSASSVRVDPLLFSAAQVTAEIGAWHRLQGVVGDRVSLRLGRPSGYSDGSGPATRTYVVRTSAAMRAVAARWPTTTPVVDPTFPTAWSAPGLQLSAMPSPAVMAAVSALGDAVSLAPTRVSALGTGTYGVVLGNVRGFGVELMSYRDGRPTMPTSMSDVVAGTRAAFGAGAAEVDWQHARSMSSVVAGDCGTVTLAGRTVTTHWATTTDDDWFAAMLADAGYPLPDGIRAGVCV